MHRVSVVSAYWSWLLTIVGVTGIYVAGRKSYWGWAIGLGAQALWLAYSIQTHQYGFTASCLVYGAVYAKNLRKWRRDTLTPRPTEGGER